MIYPARLVADSNATLLATFPDFPEAATFGANVADTLVHAQDALLTVIAARIDDAEDVPLPSPVREDLHAVELSALAEAKILLWKAMCAESVSKADLAHRIGWQLPQVERLLNPFQASPLDELETALRALGKRLALAVS
jgi:antitoxin HicB